MEEMRRQVVESKALAENARGAANHIPTSEERDAQSETIPRADCSSSCQEAAHHHSHPAGVPQHRNPTVMWRHRSGS